MDVSRPYAAVASGAEGDVLMTLVRTTALLTGRQVARLSGGSPATVSRALQRLVAHGLVTAQPVGRAQIYALNRHHLAMPAVLALSQMRDQLIAFISNSLRGAPEPMHASIFGSAARGDGGVDSDINLFVVRPRQVAADDARWRAKLDALCDEVQRRTGNTLSVAEVSQSELATLQKTRPAVVAELQRDAIDLLGPKARELLRKSR